MRTLLVILVAGCASSSSISDADRRACEDVGAAVTRVLSQAVVVGVAEHRDDRNLYTEHCIADGWSAQMRACMLGAKFGAALAECERNLTTDQRDRFHADAKAQLEHMLEQRTR